MTSQTPTRADGVGYIDEVIDNGPIEVAPCAIPAPVIALSDSGSSVEEDEESDAIADLSVGDDSEASSSRSSTYEHEEHDDDEEEWDVEREDWDLATGDFTKQYNRLRQVHAAAGQSSKLMLPARNQTRAAPSAAGVALNPKVASEGHERDKSDRATLEQVLDARTRLVLTGLVNRDVIGRVNRCISTGKEANVYHASPSSTSTTPSAVKVYRTSILAFRSRQSYMEGEHRFRGEYTSSKNPRKMVRVWAEKEMRNLKRLEQSGVRSPKAIEVKQNVLVMEFLGNADERVYVMYLADARASPRLKDAELTHDRTQDLYVELLVSVRSMFQECKLVHADLSEYNLLYHDDHIYIIDVSQSVEEDHPRAFDFLRHDISNLEAFFSKKGVKTLGTKRAWEYITGTKHEHTEEAIRILLEQPHDPIDDAVFMASFIPRTLGEVYDPERDTDMIKAGRGDELIYAEMAGLALKDKPSELSATPDDEAAVAVFTSQGFPDQAVCGSGSGESEDDAATTVRSRGFRHEDREAKKERKKAVKEENREKRKHKMPKAEKQKLVRKTAR